LLFTVRRMEMVGVVGLREVGGGSEKASEER
jgi:hypothetical protein